MLWVSTRCLVMMNEIFIGLEAKDPEANRLRSWQVEAGPDLFGVWTVKVCFGRIGTVGRAVRHDFASEAEANHSCAQGCAGARQRSGGLAWLTARLQHRRLLNLCCS
jgi:predicted DNA-binding WGR domain protein